MKVIFSRKGVDSAAGKCASALIDGAPVSIPIPTTQLTPTRYGDLAEPLRSIAADLSNGALAGERPCHLDPDIAPGALTTRHPGWRGAFGQVSASLSHLRNQGVGVGDLFLFWGLFRPTEHRDGRWRYAGPRVHALFGWLQVGEIFDLRGDHEAPHTLQPGLAGHPHVRAGWSGENALYVAADRLSLDEALPGSGVFRRAVPLTAPGATGPSSWRSPPWLNPQQGGTGLSYHRLGSWSGVDDLRASSRGQEFVADAGDRVDAAAWLAALFREAA